MVLLEMVCVPEPVLLIPVTTCVVELVAAVLALMLFAVDVLPIVLPLIVTVALFPVLDIPVIPLEIEVVLPFAVIDPILLFVIDKMDAEASEQIPKVKAPEPLVVVIIDPVPVVLPIVFPDVVPIFADPLLMYTPVNIPDVVLAFELLLKFMFAMVFPCMLDGFV